MNSTITPLRSCSVFLSAVALCLAATSTVNAEHISHGDFIGSTVMFLDVEEVANTPGDEAPLFGTPSIVGDLLDFDPSAFSATSTNGTSDITDGQLNFTLMSQPGSVLTDISISEGGDYSLLGTGTSVTQVSYGLSLSTVTVLEVDGVALDTPVSLASTSVFGTANLGAGQVSGADWSLSLAYDVSAALANAGVDFVNGATKLEIAINNTLSAISETSSIAFIAKKDFNIDVGTEVPEPASCLLLGFAAIGAGWMYQRRS